METLLSIVVVLIVIALAVVSLDYLPIGEKRVINIAKFAVIAIGALVILSFVFPLTL